MTSRFRKPWSATAWTPNEQLTGKACSRRLRSCLLVSPTSRLGNEKAPVLAVPGKCRPALVMLNHTEMSGACEREPETFERSLVRWNSLLVLAMIDLAAMRWGWDSTEAYHPPEWEK